MIAYFDASALAKRYVEETDSARVLRWLERSTSAACRLSEVEIASALARRCREGAISSAARDRVLAALSEDLLALHVVELSHEVVSAARGVLLKHVLRAADAVQLASAMMLRERCRSPVAFVTFDEHLAAAAHAEGMAGELETR